MGGFGPVNNNGPNYVQTYGKRNIGQYFEMKFTKKTTHMYMGKFNTYIKQFKPKNLLKKLGKRNINKLFFIIISISFTSSFTFKSYFNFQKRI